jgi:F-type H+-transporting ATPase subunit b
MKRNRHAFFFASAAMMTIFIAATAHAAEEGGAAGAQTATEIFKWINFAIVSGVILWLCLKKAPGFFRGRAEAIGSAITKAGSAKAVADAQLREAETKLANLQKEVAELRAFAERESSAEVERIQAATRSDEQKIAAAAKAEIEAAERAARLELKALAAMLAVD